MSVNHHFFSTAPAADAWSSCHANRTNDSPPKSHPTTSDLFSFSLNNDELSRYTEPLFEKILTPSDVGKLNRLVIPKQHAERNFPMNIGFDSGENGLLLSFQDDLGKSWRFRYSYWNSSQSYVLTKGWSRFVKEKSLDAGDIVTFSRNRAAPDCRLFIGYRRRSLSREATITEPVAAVPIQGGGWNRGIYSHSGQPYPHRLCEPGSGSSAVGNGNSRKLRLFGVNMDLEFDADDPHRSTAAELDSPNLISLHPYHHHQYYKNHLDMIVSSEEDDI